MAMGYVIEEDFIDGHEVNNDMYIKDDIVTHGCT
jgi:hypothetical protein